MPGDPVEDLLRDTTDDTADPVASLLADTAGPAMAAPTTPATFFQNQPPEWVETVAPQAPPQRASSVRVGAGIEPMMGRAPTAQERISRESVIPEVMAQHQRQREIRDAANPISSAIGKAIEAPIRLGIEDVEHPINEIGQAASDAYEQSWRSEERQNQRQNELDRIAKQTVGPRMDRQRPSFEPTNAGNMARKDAEFSDRFLGQSRAGQIARAQREAVGPAMMAEDPGLAGQLSGVPAAIGKTAMGVAQLATPIGWAILASRAALNAQREAEARGESVPAVTKAGSAVAKGVEAWDEDVARPAGDIAKNFMEDASLPGAEVAKGATELGVNFIPFMAEGAKATPRDVVNGAKRIGRAIDPTRTLPVPEGGLPPVRGTPDARPLPPPNLAGLRPAQVEGSPLPPIPERPLPPAVSGETAPVGSSIEAAKNLRPKTPQVSATLEGQTVRAKPPRIIGGGTRTIGRATPEDLAARVLAKREAAPTTEVTPVRPAVPPEGPAAARPVEAVPAEAAPREAPASPPRAVAEPEAPPARIPVAEAPVAEGVAPGGAGQAPRKVTPVAKNRFILQEQGADGMWRKVGEAKSAAESYAWENGEAPTPKAEPAPLTTEPAEVVKPTQPEPAQAPAVSEKVPTISDKAEPIVAPKEVMPSANDVRPSPRIDDVRPAATKAAPPTEVTPPSTEPPLVAKMRAEPDAEARAAIWRDTARTDRAAAEEAISWARRKQAERGEKDGSFIGRDAIERELNPPKPKKIGGGRAKGGKQSGELDPLAAPQALSDIYDLADRGARSIVRGVGGMVSEIPGVRKVIGKASEVYDKNFKSEAAQVGPEYASETASRRGAQNLGREEGRRAASEIDDAIGSLPEDAQEGVYRYMNSEADTLPPAAAKYQKIIDSVSAQIKDIGQQMVDRGILSQEAFDQYQRFLMRRYRAKQGSPFKSIGDGTRARVERNYVREDAPGVYFEAKKGYPEIEAIAKKHDGYALTYKGDQGAVKFKTPEARDAFVAELDEVLGGTRKRLGENATKEIRKGNVLDAKQAMEARSDVPRRSDLVEKFDPLSDEVRAALGEITDPTRAVLDTLIKGKLKIADHDFLAGLEGKGDGKGAWTAAEKTPGYEKMTQDWAGPLRNKWVRADVAADLIGTFQSADVPGFTRGWLNQWKANKTVWSPRTAMRQWFGNPMFMHFAGVNPANPINYQAMFKAIKSLRRDSGLRTELVREGVIGPHDFANIELQSMPDAPTNVRYKAGQAAANPLMLFKFGEKAQQGLGKFYGASDAFTRATIYWKMRENGMSPRQAAAEVRRWTPNYDDSGALVKKLRTSVIGSPFATYKFETYRIIGEALKDHPVRLATGLSFIYGAQKALDMMGADTVTDAERKAIAENFGMQEMILGRDDEGRPLTFGAKYINPIGGIEKSPDRIGEDGTLEYLASLAGVEQSPLVDTISTLSRGEDRSGRPVFDGPMPTTMEKLIGGAKAYGRQVAPSLTPGLGANAAQIAAATQGKQLSEKIPKQSALQAWISGLLGVDIRPADFDLMQNNMQRRAIGLASGEKSNARKKMSQGDEGAEAQAVGKIADLENEYNERIDVVDKASQAQRKAAK